MAAALASIAQLAIKGTPKKLVVEGLQSIQRQITAADAGVSLLDTPSILRVLDVQSESVEEDMRLKVLQTLPLLLSQPGFTPDAPLLCAVMAMCFSFLRDRSVVLKNAATATLQQAVALMFERAERLLRDGAAGAAVAAAEAAGDFSAVGSGGGGGGSARARPRPPLRARPR
jgi:hypothetical protein